MTKQGYFSCFGCVPSSSSKNPFSSLSPYKWGVAVGVLCLVLTNVIAQSIPWVVKWTVDTITDPSENTGSLHQLALLLMGMALGQAVIRILSRLTIFNAGRDAEYDLRKALFARLTQLDGDFYRAFRTGDLMSRLTNDLSSVRALYGPGILHVVNTVFAYVVALPLMIRIDPWLTLWCLVPYIVLLSGARLFARGIYGRSKEMQVSLAAMTANVQENLAGVRELKNYALEEHRAGVFGRRSAEYLDEAMRLARWRAGLIPFVGVGAGTSLVLALWLGGREVIQGNLTLGDLVAFNMYVGLLAWPTMAVGWMLSLWNRGVAAWHRLDDILSQKSALEISETNPALELSAVEAPSTSPPDIVINDLCVAFGEAEVLRGVSFNVPAGSLCAVVGRVGCGKTTLAEALARLVVVPEQSVFLGGVDVTEVPVEQVRDQIAYAPQSAFLFSISIRENIALGLAPGVDPGSEEAAAQIRRAVEAAGLEVDLDGFTDGLDTVVGERGLSLSGGQRQRVALARALVSDRRVLVLDDSLSSVDSSTEKRILAQLQAVLEGRTAILISHRLSALQHAQQVVVLDEGRVTERGTHEELLEAGGVYAELYRKQVLEELE